MERTDAEKFQISSDGKIKTAILSTTEDLESLFAIPCVKWIEGGGQRTLTESGTEK